MFEEDLYGLGEVQTGPVSSTRAPGLEFQQDSTEAAGLFPRPNNPGYSSLPSGSSNALPQQGGGSNIEGILRTIVPALAAAYAMKKGSGFGSFMGGMQDQQQMQMRQQDQQADMEFRQQQMERQQMMDQRQMQEDEMRAQAQEQARREHHEQQMRQVLSGALSQAAENPNFMEMVNSTGPDKYSINVPGMGNINLKAAFDQIGVVQSPDGKYNYGRPPVSNKADIEKPQEYSYEDEGGNTVSELMTPSERAKRGVLVKNKYKAPVAPKPDKPPAQRTATSEEFSGGKVWTVTVDPITGKELHRRVKRRMTEREMQEQGGDDTGSAAAPSGKDPLGIR